jgi:hypothetical protein
MRTLAALLAAATTLPLSACTVEDDIFEGETVKTEDGKDDASSVALFVDFEFDGKLFTTSSWGSNEQTIEDQLLYTIGLLNGENSVGRLDTMKLTNVRKTSVTGGYEISYHAVLPVAWGDKVNVPTSFELRLPRDMSYTGVEKFVTSYSHSCVDWGAHDVDSGSMWYYYRPAASGCALAAGDIVKVNASVSVSPINTTGKYPEYTKVWEDNVLEVLAIFGKYEDGATSGDAGIDAYNSFVRSMKTELGTGATTVPASVPSSPGVAVPDIEFRATLTGGKSVHVVALLVDNVRLALDQAAFRTRYENLSTRADLIIYNGHAGLGTNVRALARNGKWVAGQYVIVFMNGCDTFAYVDSALNDSHKQINPDDTTGHKYIDIVTNGMPAFFANMAGASMSLFRGLMKHSDPQTYENIFRSVDRSQVVLVAGEQDNVFQPGGGGPVTPGPWAGIRESGTIAKNAEKRWQTPTLAAGTYLFEMTGTADADLYVRRGSAPTTSSFDCRPYKTGSNESCRVTLSAPGVIHAMVRGWATSSQWDLSARKE